MSPSQGHGPEACQDLRITNTRTYSIPCSFAAVKAIVFLGMLGLFQDEKKAKAGGRAT